MERVEVDPKLFVTCRLCLEDTGIYQITPIIQHQIKYCFDIQVAPFDGLPQLICKNCESKLTEYNATKTAYETKQKYLFFTLQNKKFKNYTPASSNNEGLQSTEAQSVTAEKQTNIPNNLPHETADSIKNGAWIQDSSPPVGSQKAVKRKRRRIESSSSSASDGTKVKPTILKKTKSRSKHNWHSTDYTKHFVCKACSKAYVKRTYLMKHYSNIHSPALKKYKSILNTLCSVQIEKLDNKPNFTGDSNSVVFNKDKVIVNEESNKYYIVYYSKRKHMDSDDFGKETNENDFSDSSNDAEYLVSKKKGRNRSRLLSSDTVVIEKKDENEKISSENEDHCKGNNKNIVENITECINLDSDSETETSSEIRSTDNKLEEENIDSKLIRNIVDVCHSKYIRNIAAEKNTKPNYADIQYQLMHKVLNMGQKILTIKYNKQGINCTGLLRFLEYRNIGVIWLPKTGHFFSGPAVRLSMTTLKKDYQRSEDSDMGWTDILLTANSLRVDNINENLSTSKETDKQDLINTVPQTSENSNVIVTNEIYSNDTQINITGKLVQSDKHDHAYIYKLDDANSSGKLLNKNPVANPKQLPKKTIHYEIKPNKNILDNDVELQPQNTTIHNEPLLFSEPPEGDNDLTGMPIITSTTSLASDYYAIEKEREESKSDNVSKESNITNSPVSVPRIKVKPVSELMPDNVTTPNNLLLNYNNQLTNMTQMIEQSNPAQPLSGFQMPTENPTLPEENKNNSELIILNTIHLPNTKTDSPFKYLKSLLGLHNIHLMETNTPEFQCLIKFKVLFKQEAVKPIVLCLSLHCNFNQFYIGIRDSTNISIDMKKISANWQWEIIKIFQGDVCNKIEVTAQKMGLGVLTYTKKFLCLIKSIQMLKV